MEQMTLGHSNAAARRRAPRSAQRGVVLFVALIAMVVLSLAGVALIRATDAGTSVAGNLSFRQSSIALINIAVEKAADDIFYHGFIVDTTVDDVPHNFYATIQAGENSHGVPRSGAPRGRTRPASRRSSTPTPATRPSG